MATAYIGLGANLGDARAAVVSAFEALAALPGTRVVARSPLYRSAPVDAQGPDFINAVASVETSLTSSQLLDRLQAIEHDHGRERPFHHAPRTLDLDLLAFDNEICAQPNLTLPHPRLHQRAFVLRPLLDIAPNLELPGLGRLQDRLLSLSDQSLERLNP